MTECRQPHNLPALAANKLLRSCVTQELSEYLTEFREKAKTKQCSSCFIVIMSHGGSTADSIVMDDMEEMDLYRDIVYPFSDHDYFRNKPKIFIVQACRNSRDPRGRRERDAHVIQDVLIAHSTFLMTQPTGVSIQGPFILTRLSVPSGNMLVMNPFTPC